MPKGVGKNPRFLDWQGIMCQLSRIGYSHLLGADNMTLLELLERYLPACVRGASPNTKRLYLHTIRSFQKFLGHEPTIADLTNENIENHMWAVVNSGCSPQTANKNRSQLICLWSYANRETLLPNQPSVPALKEPEIVPLGWMPDEVAALLRAAERDDSMVGDSPARIYFPAMLRLCLDTGERIGALRQLSRNALQGQFIHVPASVRKSKTRDKLYRLNDDTVEWIARLLTTHREKLIFPWPYKPNYIYNRFDRILERAGLPTDRRSKFHRIRRTVASAVARAGGDPTAALDHSSPKTTRKYLDPRIVGGTQTCEILSQYLRDPTLRASQGGQHSHRKLG